MKNFDESILNALNAEQRTAVEAIYGTVLVVAGPGTGKTHMLTARIAHILQQTDANPQNILCLTFTEAGATAMRMRLIDWIGEDAYRVTIETFHGFCDKVMARYGQYFTERRTGAVADDLQKALCFRSVIDKGTWKHLSSVHSPYGSQWDVMRGISDAKREGWTVASLRAAIPDERAKREADPANFYQKKYKDFLPGDFKPTARANIDRTIEKLEEFCTFWEQYERCLSEQGLYDFDDMLIWVRDALATHESLRLDLQEQYQFFLVDEYQDTNTTQNDIVWSLTDYWEEPNLFAVGDDDQSIYRFQGANIQNILDFRSRFPKAQIINLTQNYRSTQQVLDGAYRSVQHNLERLDSEKTLTATTNDRTEPVMRIFRTRFAELVALGQYIESAMKSGTKPAEIAVLCRDNREVREVTDHLLKQGMAVQSDFREDVFHNPSVRHLISIVRLLASPEDEHAWFEVLLLPMWKLSPHVRMRMMIDRHEQRSMPFWDWLGGWCERETGIAAVRDRISALCDTGESFSLAICSQALHGTGLGAWICRDGNVHRIDDLLAIQKFLSWADEQNVSTLSDLLYRVDLYRELKLRLLPDPRPTQKNAVHVLTAHKSKGREFHTVCVPGLVDSIWGNRRSRTGIILPRIDDKDHDANEEERRLFFVALTRAKRGLYLSYAETDLRSTKERTPSQFWQELPEDWRANIPLSDELERQAQELLPVFFASERPQFVESEKEFLLALVAKFRWSASALNRYLKCPRQFLYQDLFRLPQRTNTSMIYGSAIHKALERSVREGLSSPEEVFVPFREFIEHQGLAAHEVETLLATGRDVLSRYIAWEQSQSLPPSRSEQAWSVERDGIACTGRVDRIFTSSDDPKAVRIWDYKTGSSKSIPPNSDYWRQAMMYDLLARHLVPRPFERTEMEFVFLPPKEGTDITRKSVEITDEAREQFWTQLREAHDKVQNLEFPIVPNIDDDPEIEYWQSFTMESDVD